MAAKQPELQFVNGIALHQSGFWRVVVHGEVRWTEYRAIAEMWMLEAEGKLPPGTADRHQRIRDMIARETIELSGKSQ